MARGRKLKARVESIRREQRVPSGRKHLQRGHRKRRRTISFPERPNDSINTSRLPEETLTEEDGESGQIPREKLGELTLSSNGRMKNEHKQKLLGNVHSFELKVTLAVARKLARLGRLDSAESSFTF